MAKHGCQPILTEDPLVGRWDPERIVQVLMNLRSNAVKYSPEGTPIVVEIARRGRFGRIGVRARPVARQPAPAAVAGLDALREDVAGVLQSAGRELG